MAAKEYMNKWRKINKEHIKKYRQSYSKLEHVKQKKKEQDKLYRLNNQAKLKTYHKTYYEKNQEKLKRAAKIHRLKNPEKIKNKKKQWYLKNKKIILEKQKQFKHKKKEQNDIIIKNPFCLFWNRIEREQENQIRKDRSKSWMRLWRLKNKERIEKYTKAYRIKNRELINKNRRSKDIDYRNKPKVREYRKKWREENRLKLLSDKKQHYISKRDFYLDLGKKRYQQNPEEFYKRNRKQMEKIAQPWNMRGTEMLFALCSWSRIIKRNKLCMVCQDSAKVAHHLLYKKYYPKLCLNENNGIALCIRCHQEIHGADPARLKPLEKRLDIRNYAWVRCKN